MKISTLHLMALLEKQRQIVQLTKRQGSEGFVAMSALLATLLVGCGGPDEPLAIGTNNANEGRFVVPNNLGHVAEGDGYIIANVTGYNMNTSSVLYNGSNSDNVYISPGDSVSNFSIAMYPEDTYNSFFPDGDSTVNIVQGSDGVRIFNMVTLSLSQGESDTSPHLSVLLPGNLSSSDSTANFYFQEGHYNRVFHAADKDNDGNPGLALKDGVVEVDWDDVDMQITFDVTITTSDDEEHVITVVIEPDGGGGITLAEDVSPVWVESDFDDILTDLSGRTCDAIISAIEKTDDSDEPFNFTRAYYTSVANVDFGIVVRNDSTELLAALDVAIGAVVDPDSEQYNAIYSEWAQGSVPAVNDDTTADTATAYPTPTKGGTLADVLESGQLTLCTSPNFQPFESYDNDGNVVGFDVDIANALVEEIEAHYII